MIWSRMGSRFGLYGLLLLCVGCAAPQYERAAQAADPQGQQDTYECRREGLQIGTGNVSPLGILSLSQRRVMDDCMAARGYRRAP